MSVSLVLLCFAIAPGDAPEAKATVEGTVHLDGLPLKKGEIIFHDAAKKKSVTIKIIDGKFEKSPVHSGKFKVAIKGKGVPAKYSSPETTTLTVEIKSGANVLRFELKS